MAKQIVVTESSFQKLKDELDYLKNVKRKEAAENVGIARSYGDLSENSEYDEAKNEQAKIEARIVEIEAMLKNVEIIEDVKGKAKTVVILVATAFGAIFGQLLGDFASIAVSIVGTEYTFIDIPFLYVYILSEEAEALQSTLTNLGMGLLFAMLGGYGILRKAHAEDKNATLKTTILE